ncbi:hypothetical protein [Paenibacillus harenae]|uniref:hypothetical protein n=1 Tax=Paenibacillus harenae TaxID=306543 RepID=UPI00278EEEAE|nr:hypothetical protein [Paenibacillus harenae]MDQ0062376.1 hypothetical protein [Paenibacillus harenae]
MDIFKPFKAAGKAVKEMLDTVSEVAESAADEVEQEARLQYWQNKLEVSKASYPLDAMDEREYIYLGSRGVDANVNSKQRPSKMANMVYNIAYEFTESQVDPTVPQPSVKSKRPEYSWLATMIEDSLANDIAELGIERINDYNERITPVQGLSIIEVAWNPDYKHKLHRGEIQLISRHPKQLIPQQGIYRLQEMDYFFVLESMTKEQIMRDYGKDVDYAGEEHSDVTNLSGNENSFNNENEKVTKITCWYKDEDDDISKFSWVEHTVLEDYPKFFYRRLDRCTSCNEVKDLEVFEETGQCAMCGSTKFESTIEKEETLAAPMRIGNKELLPVGTQVPYFVPTRYPFSIRINVPKNFSFEGQSDVDVIRDQQDTIKKAATKAEEKIIKGGSVFTLAEDQANQITDETYQIIRMTPQQKQVFGVENLQADIGPELMWIQDAYKKAQSMLGITDSFQGKEDPTAKSGVAKQIQVQQASGRMQSKQKNKYEAFKELFEIMWEFKLAFYDELRPYLPKDQEGKEMLQVFDKYAFVLRDGEGKLYYNTDFIFSADSAQGLPKDKIFIFNQAKEMSAAGLIDPIQFWGIMEQIGFPNAKLIKKQLEERQQAEQQAQQQKAMIDEQNAQAQLEQANQPASFDDEVGSLPGPMQDMYKKLPPEARAQIMKQAMGG